MLRCAMMPLAMRGVAMRGAVLALCMVQTGSRSPTQRIGGGGCGIAPGLAAELPRPSFRMRAIGEKHYH